MTIKEMVTSNEYRHMPLKTLARFAQRVGRVFAAPSTWGKLVRARGWRRPRLRVYPAKPQISIRATRPDDIEAVRKLVEFYVHNHNAVMPHSAFRGQTPDEIYCGTGGNVTAELEAAAKVAQQRRLTANRAARCHRCVPEDVLPPPSTAGEESLRFRDVAFAST